jgi:hypothetical protein
MSSDHTADVPPSNGPPVTQPRTGLVDRHAGVRKRIADIAMFEVPRPGTYPMTCRVQLFMAAGLRPVLVGTQMPEEGTSLVNAAEDFAAAAWQRLTPQLQEPPLWISLLVSEADPDGRTAIDASNYPRLVEFRVAGPYRLAHPRWHLLSPPELDHLVGVRVDLTRGRGYEPQPRDPEPVQRLDARELFGLPRTNPFRAECLARSAEATPTPSWRRALRRLATGAASPTSGTCCWYHGGNWHAVSRHAVDLLEQSRRRGVSEDDIVDDVLRHAGHLGLDTWHSQALSSLFLAPLAVDDGLWINGQHRCQAMLDAGVRQTVMSHLQYPDAAPDGQTHAPKPAH